MSAEEKRGGPRLAGYGLPTRAYKLEEAFRRIGIGKTWGYKLLADDIIKTVQFGPHSRRVTDVEITRLLTEGFPAAPVPEPAVAASPQPVTPTQQSAPPRHRRKKTPALSVAV
jgi:hypothetical protein